MTGITPKQRGKELRKILKGIYDDGKGADFDNVVDCLTDLRHLCLAYNLDFFRADRMARDHAGCEQFSNNLDCEHPRRKAEGRS